jgi:hypothetical protein
MSLRYGLPYRATSLIRKRSSWDPTVGLGSQGAMTSSKEDYDIAVTQLEDLQGYLDHKKQSPPQDHHRTLGMSYCRVLGEGCFLSARYRCRIPLMSLRYGLP